MEETLSEAAFSGDSAEQGSLTNPSISCKALEPKPSISSNSSIARNRPCRTRCKMIAEARDRPIPGSVINSGIGAVLRSTRYDHANFEGTATAKDIPEAVSRKRANMVITAMTHTTSLRRDAGFRGFDEAAGGTSSPENPQGPPLVGTSPPSPGSTLPGSS